MLLTLGIFKCALISAFGLGLIRENSADKSAGISCLVSGVLLIGALLLLSPYSPAYAGDNWVAGLFAASMSVVALVTMVAGCYVLPALNKRKPAPFAA